MVERLTLRIDRSLIERAEAYARSRGKSISGLVADYFALLGEAPGARQSGTAGGKSLPPVTSSLRGVLRGATVDEEDHRRYLERKFG